jgi:hypothetical protein
MTLREYCLFRNCQSIDVLAMQEMLNFEKKNIQL